MKISNHIHVVVQVHSCLRYEIHIDPPVDHGALLGDDDRVTTLGSIYPPHVIPVPEIGPSVISAEGILHMIEFLPLGGIISLMIQPGHVLKDIVLRQEDI